MTRISQKGTSQIRPADTCPAKGEAPARPGRKTERPQTGHRRATGPAAGAGKAAGAGGDYTVAGRGSAASNKAARPCWVMMEISCNARASTAERSGSSAGACCFRKGSTSAPSRPRASTTKGISAACGWSSGGYRFRLYYFISSFNLNSFVINC